VREPDSEAAASDPDMTWLLALAFAISPDADRQMRLQPDARVSVGADGRLQHVEANHWRITPRANSDQGDLFYLPSSDTNQADLSAQVNAFSDAANVYVPATSGDFGARLTQATQRFEEYEAKLRGGRALAILGVGDGAELATAILNSRNGRWGDRLAAAYIVPADGDTVTSPGGLSVCHEADATRCVVSWTAADVRCDDDKKPKGEKKTACVNPLNMRSGSAAATATMKATCNPKTGVLEVESLTGSLLEANCDGDKKPHKDAFLFVPQMVQNLKVRLSAASAAPAAHVEQGAQVSPDTPVTLPEEGRETPPQPAAATKLSNQAYEDYKERPADMPQIADPESSESDPAPQDERPGKTASAFANVSPPKGFLPQACARSMLGEGQSASVAASSSKPGHGPALAVIDDDASHAWMSETSDDAQWLEVTWPESREIRYIQAGGLEVNKGLLTKFKIQYKDADDQSWKWYVKAGDTGLGHAFSQFSISADAPAVDLVALNPPVQTRAIKIWAVDWQTAIALRLDAKGCPASEVEAADLDLNVKKDTLFPNLFENFGSLASEFRNRISQQLKCGLDQVQVISVTASGDKSVINIHILPKSGGKAPADLISELETTLKDAGSALSTFLNDVENSQGRVATVNKQHTCKAVDCGDHGTCMGGKCFCVEGYAGEHCTDRYDKKKPLIDENGEQIDPKTGEAIITVDEENLPMDNVEPLGLLPGGDIPPAFKEEDEKALTPEETAEDSEQISTETQEEVLDEEAGVSGTVKRHMIIVGLVIGGLVLIGGCLVLAAGRKKGEPLIGGADSDDGNPVVRERD